VSRAAPVDMRPAMKSLLAGAALLTLVGCRTISTRPVANASTPHVRVGQHERTWAVESSGKSLGFVVLFQERGLARDSLYVVRNRWHQDLGLIDGLGRAFRYLPHHEEPVWVGSGTIVQGAREILCAEADCELVELADPACGSPDDAQEPAEPPSDAPRPEGGLPQSR
jgi:hypothetical protein